MTKTTTTRTCDICEATIPPGAIFYEVHPRVDRGESHGLLYTVPDTKDVDVCGRCARVAIVGFVAKGAPDAR